MYERTLERNPNSRRRNGYSYFFSQCDLIDAETRKRGIVIPFADLQIGVTALVFDYAVLTLNFRDFEAIPGLRVKRA